MYDIATRAFLESEFLSLTVNAALQRSGTYLPGTPEQARTQFREDVKGGLLALLPRYVNGVAEADHVSTIERFCEDLSRAHGAILRGARLRVGVAQKAVNLFLKYAWCAGWIAEPPHCPFDRILIDLLPPSQRLAWTRLDSVHEYLLLVANAKRVAGSESLARWELRAYRDATARSV